VGTEELAEGRQTGQVILAYDGSAAAEHALGAAARVLVERRALVLVVWKSGLGFELLEIRSLTGLPPAPIDIRTALEIDEDTRERAQRLAERGARIAREAGFDAEAAAVPISNTIVTVAKERGAPAVVVGERARGRLGEVFLSDISRDVIRHAPCPVVVTRHPAG
jgi:nucleotide-binding universal stress UspA family protein